MTSYGHVAMILNKSFIIFLLSISFCVGYQWKIIGGYVEMRGAAYSRSSSRYGTMREWGEPTRAQSVSYTVLKHYCYDWKRNERCYCFTKLVLSTRNDPHEEYYQIVGSRLEIYDQDSEFLYQTAYKKGKHVPDLLDEDIVVAEGEVFSHRQDKWGYGYLHFVLEKTIKPPVVEAFSTIAFKLNSNYRYHIAECTVGSKESTAVRTMLSEFRCFTGRWSRDSICKNYMWLGETRLTDFSLLFNRAQVFSVHSQLVTALSIENHGSQLTKDNLPKIRNEITINSTSTARLTSRFDFDFTIAGYDETYSSYSYESIRTIPEFEVYGMNYDIPLVPGGFSTKSAHFYFSSSLELQRTMTRVDTMTVQWPTSCPAGLRCSYSVIETSEKQLLPVEFYFSRARQTWNETKTLEVVLKSLALRADDCCLYSYANELCGTEQLPNCRIDSDQSSEQDVTQDLEVN